MNVVIRGNISAFQRELGMLTTGPNSIYARGERALRQVLLEEFHTLVQETPQYSGSTAASWRIGFYAPTEYTMMWPPSSAADALAKGMDPAVSIAVGYARESLGVTGYGMLKNRQDITITNGAPGYETAEEGPVRQVNTPPGALKRFVERFSHRVIALDDYWK